MKTNLLLKRLFVAFLFLAVSTVSWAYNFEIGGIYYNINENGTSVTVTTGLSKYTGSVNIPSSVQYNDVTYSVTAIGTRAFYECTDLTSVTIPNSVKSIAWQAFMKCTNLNSVNIPEGITTITERLFESCVSLSSITIPETVTTIEQYAFNGCDGLTSIVIPDAVVTVANNAFYHCI